MRAEFILNVEKIRSGQKKKRIMSFLKVFGKMHLPVLYFYAPWRTYGVIAAR